MTPTKNLLEAIDAATHERLKTVLRSVCSENPAASKIVSDALLLKPGDAGAPSKKRKAGDSRSTLRYDMCVNCKTEYDTTTNDKYSCLYHEGEFELDMDNDYWADHDEPLEVLNTKENRKDHPGGFIWECCDTIGDELEDEKINGCRMGPHRSLQDMQQITAGKLKDESYSVEGSDGDTSESESDSELE